MANEINELIRKKEELIERLNKLITTMNFEENPDKIKKLISKIIQTLKELEEL